MDRRKFLGSAALGGIPVVVSNSVFAQSGSLPASLNGGKMVIPKDGLLSLPMDSSFVSPSLRDLTNALSALFSNVRTNQSVAKDLIENPKKVLDSYGLSEYITPDDPIVEAVRMSTDRELSNFIKNADYRTFMTKLKAKGYLSKLSKSKLRQHYLALLSTDQQSFAKYLKPYFDSNLVSSSSSQAGSERLNRIIDLLQEGTGKKFVEQFSNAASTKKFGDDESPYPDPGGDPEFAAVGALVYIAAGVITYVAVISQAAVAVNVVAAVSVVTKLAVWGAGNEPSSMSVSSEKTAAHESIRNMQRSAIAASLSGRKDLMIESIKTTINQEIEAVFWAAEQAGIIKLPSKKRTEVMREAKLLVLQAVGIGS